MGIGLKVLGECLTTAIKCALLITVSVLVCRRDLVPVSWRDSLPPQLAPFEAADERTRQTFIVGLVACAFFAMRIKGGWMHAKES
mmetsp:Transcript_1909/g.5784  ORF Transcript_1909/g.5784 Transcript_1909/m.5784 type:complete len:85 (+) Transcript_1909:166-420(+)